MFDFLKIKQSITQAAAAVHEVSEQIESKTRELERQMMLPLPQADFCDYLCEDIDARADRWSEQLQTATKGSMEKYTSLSPVLVLENFGGMADANRVHPTNLYGIFREPIKAAVRAEIMSWPWPAVVGLPRAKREDLIAKLKQEIVDLKSQRAELLHHAKEAGVDMNSVAVDDTKIFAGGTPATPAAIAKARENARRAH